MIYQACVITASSVSWMSSRWCRQHLVGDIERLRVHLGIDRWVVVGGSWEVTLALVYAERYPERVLGMVLAAVTSGRWKETQWITRDMGRVFPREWDHFVDLVPGTERDGNLAAAYARLLASPDQALREEAARRWCAWEDTHMSLAPDYTPHLSVRDLSWQWFTFGSRRAPHEAPAPWNTPSPGTSRAPPTGFEPVLP